VTKILDLLSCEFAFVEVRIEVVFLEDLEDRLKICEMLLSRFAEDEDVVQIDNDEAVQEGLEDRVHETLERGWSIAESKGHDKELVVAISRPKRCFRNVLVLDANLPVSRAKIELCEVVASCKPIEEVIDARKRILVFDCDIVERPIINTHVEATVLLLDKEDRCSIW
jgi:formyltetrahydrofolate hydrolase